MNYETVGNVESYIVPAAQKRFGIKYVEEWMSNLLEAQRGDQTWKTELLM